MVRSLRSSLGARVPLAVLAFVLVAGSTRVGEARRYTLPELIDRVTAAYAGVQAGRAAIDSAQAQVAQANGLWWPQGAITFGITGTPKVECADANNVSSPDQHTRESNCINTSSVDFLHFSSFEQILPVHGVGVSFGINFVQPLYTFGKIESAQHAAAAGLDVARAGLDKEKSDVIVNVTRAYWGLKWSRAAWATLDDGRTRLKEWVVKIDGDLDKPKTTYTQSDLARLKLALDTAEYSILDIERARSIALSGLRALTNDSEADVDADELDVVGLTEQPLSYYEDVAVVARPEARMLAAGERAAHANRALQAANLTPDLGIATSLNIGYASSVDDPNNAFMNHPNTIGFGLALVMRYNLDVAERVATWRKAKADERLVDARRQQALGGIALEIESAWLDTTSARKKSDLLAHSEKVARGWYNSVDEAMNIGTGNARDLVEAARNYFELRLRRLQSIMDVNMAATQLKMATGTLTR